VRLIACEPREPSACEVDLYALTKLASELLPGFQPSLRDFGSVPVSYRSDRFLALVRQPGMAALSIVGLSAPICNVL
jgi:hypothetical protein